MHPLEIDCFCLEKDIEVTASWPLDFWDVFFFIANIKQIFVWLDSSYDKQQ